MVPPMLMRCLGLVAVATRWDIVCLLTMNEHRRLVILLRRTMFVAGM